MRYEVGKLAVLGHPAICASHVAAVGGERGDDLVVGVAG